MVPSHFGVDHGIERYYTDCDKSLIFVQSPTSTNMQYREVVTVFYLPFGVFPGKTDKNMKYRLY